MSKEKYVAYVGTYTHEKSIGIHLYDLDVEAGTMKERKVIPINNASHLAVSHNGKYLYSIADEGVRRGVKQANIIDGRIPHSILIELLTDIGAGTMIIA